MWFKIGFDARMQCADLVVGEERLLPLYLSAYETLVGASSAGLISDDRAHCAFSFPPGRLSLVGPDATSNHNEEPVLICRADSFVAYLVPRPWNARFIVDGVSGRGTLRIDFDVWETVTGMRCPNEICSRCVIREMRAVQSSIVTVGRGSVHHSGASASGSEGSSEFSLQSVAECLDMHADILVRADLVVEPGRR
jgi:hypothetical protein